jgi:flagellar basal-body rod modification protein FlgD
MNTIDAYAGLGLTTAGSAAPKKSTLGQEQFLKLMTTQMTHQDPTKPMQNGEFLSQMAQFGTVSGIQDLQQSFKDFAASINSDQTLQAASLVGRTVSTPSKEGFWEEKPGGEIKGTVELPASSSNVDLKILDPVTNQVISVRSLGEQPAGALSFVWDGKNDKGEYAPKGVYKVQVDASIDGINTVLQPAIQARVESVSINGAKNDLQVNLAGLGAVNFNQIKQIN